MGVFGCYEVTIGFFGKERVDYMTYDTKGIFRCYEIKVSKADFKSNAKVSFVGHYNYYVMPEGLFEEVKNEIPDYVGVYVGGGKYDSSCSSVKRAKKQELKVDEQILKDSLIRSLTRYLDDKVLSENESFAKRMKRQLKELEKSKNYYLNEYQDLRKILYRKFGSRWPRVLEDMEDKYQ